MLQYFEGGSQTLRGHRERDSVAFVVFTRACPDVGTYMYRILSENLLKIVYIETGADFKINGRLSVIQNFVMKSMLTILCQFFGLTYEFPRASHGALGVVYILFSRVVANAEKTTNSS